MQLPSVFRGALIGAGSAALLLGLVFFAPWESEPVMDHLRQVRMPVLNAQAERGKTLFVTHCASCHGPEAGGGENGPPLIHPFYHPSHHADGAFYMAITRGVKAHHWRFGDMAPLPQVKLNEIPLIVKFVRRVQQYNGIF